VESGGLRWSIKPWSKVGTLLFIIVLPFLAAD